MVDLVEMIYIRRCAKRRANNDVSAKPNKLIRRQEIRTVGPLTTSAVRIHIRFVEVSIVSEGRDMVSL